MPQKAPIFSTMKKQKSIPEVGNGRFDILSEEIVFMVLDFLYEDPIDRKSFSLVCKSFHAIESRHRRFLKPLRSEHLTKVLNRYPYVTSLDLTSCPRITNASLGVISGGRCNEMLRSINLSRSKFFSHAGLSGLAMNCKNLVEIDLSNGTELKDLAAASIAEAKNLERLWLVRCKSITDIGIGCIAVGCRKLKLLNLRWCLGAGDLGVGLVAIKCKEIRSLDLSFLPITNKCLAQILELQYLEDLALEGCHGIDDEGLAALRKGCNSLQNLDISSCQSVSHVGLSSLTSVVGYLKQLSLSYGPQVDLAVADSLQKLSTLHSLKLDGCRVTSQGVKVIGRFCVSLRELIVKKTIRASHSIITETSL